MNRTQEHVLGTRRLRVLGKNRWVTVTLGTPRRVRRDEWACSFRIDGISADVATEVLGTDAIQSLMLALERIRIALDESGWRFAWGSDEDETGFPRYVPLFRGPEFATRVNRYIDRAVARAPRTPAFRQAVQRWRSRQLQNDSEQPTRLLACKQPRPE